MTTPSSPLNNQKGDGKQFLSLRVVKIPMPSFHPLSNYAVDQLELPKYMSLTKNGLNTYETVTEINDIKSNASKYFNNIISIPQNQNIITFGETFQFYLQCSNDSEQSVFNVIVIIEFRSTKKKKFTLVNTTNNPIAELEPSKTMDYSFHYRLEEPTTYFLNCKVIYTTSTGKTLPLKKIFKLQVNSAFNPKFTIKPYNDGLIFIADITNLISTPLHLESVKLTIHGNYYTMIELHNDKERSPLESSYVHDLLLNPGDSKSYGFYLKKNSFGRENEVFSSDQRIGHLTITWRNNFGEVGYQKSDDIIISSPSNPEPVQLTIEKIPEKIILYKPFKVAFKIHNNTGKKIQPNIKPLVTDLNIKIYGASRIALPKIKKNLTHVFELEFMALEDGIQTIGGISLTDVVRTKVYNFQSIVDVVVLKNEK